MIDCLRTRMMQTGGDRTMTTKELVFRALADLPDDATIEDAIERLYFVAKLRHRLDQIDDVEKFTQDEAKARMARWLE